MQHGHSSLVHDEYALDNLLLVFEDLFDSERTGLVLEKCAERLSFDKVHYDDKFLFEAYAY